VLEREDARDAFVSNEYQNLYALPIGSRVGTSSLRRVSQLKNKFPNLEFVELRGNVNTRLKKLDDGEFDAIILAAAGLIRLDLADRIKQYISPEICLPAVGQGIVGIECRTDDHEVKKIIEPLNSPASSLMIIAERTMNTELNGGCQVPVAGYTEIDKGKLRMRGLVGEVDGSRCFQSDMMIKGISQTSALRLGRNVAKELLQQGAGDILSEIYGHSLEHEKTDKPVVLLTREERYLGNTVDLLTSLDYHPLHISTMITVPNNSSNVLTMFSQLHDFTDVLFVSRNAVQTAIPMIEQQINAFPDDIRAMAVGSETAKQLFRYNIDAVFPKEGSGADALLEDPKLQDLSGRKILVVRGSHGLDWPAEEMTRRGAEVLTVESYEHIEPYSIASQIDVVFLPELDHQIEGIFVHSPLSVKNLLPHVMRHSERLKGTKLVAGSRRIANTAKKCGWKGEIRIAESKKSKTRHTAIGYLIIV